MTYWKSPEFMALQQAWYAKLEEQGFEDIEEMSKGEMRLKHTALKPVWHMDLLDMETKESYFSMMSEKVQTETFRSTVHKSIMTLFVEGKKVGEIVEILSECGRFRCRSAIRKTITKYERKWGVKPEKRRTA